MSHRKTVFGLVVQAHMLQLNITFNIVESGIQIVDFYVENGVFLLTISQNLAKRVLFTAESLTLKV